jgi:hypothetical protein
VLQVTGSEVTEPATGDPKVDQSHAELAAHYGCLFDVPAACP